MSAHGASPKSNRMDAQGCDTRPPRLQAGEGVVFSALTPNPSPTLWELIPIAEPEFTKVRINENPLLKVPPASRGNRVGAPFAVPLAKRGEPAGGGQLMNFGRAIGIRGVGFFSRGWRGRRDARVPSTARAGSASVSLAWRQRCAAWQRREQARLRTPRAPTPHLPRPRVGEGGSVRTFWSAEAAASASGGSSASILHTCSLALRVKEMHEHTDEVIVNYTCTAEISLLGTTLAIGVYKSSPICLFLACFGRFRLTLPLCVGYTIPAHARRAT
jgi:hypothetical protein